MLKWIEVINNLTISSWIIGHSFYHTMAKILSGLALLSGKVENTALAISSLDIEIIGSSWGYLSEDDLVTKG